MSGRSKKLVYGSFLAVLLIILGFTYNWHKSSQVSPRLHMIERQVMFNSSENQMADGTISPRWKESPTSIPRVPTSVPLKRADANTGSARSAKGENRNQMRPRRRGKSSVHW